MKYIVVVDYFDSFQFFERLLKRVSKQDVHVVTNLISVYWKLRSSGMAVSLVNHWSAHEGVVNGDLSKAREVASGDIGELGAKKYTAQILYSLESCLDKDSKYKVLCWNGSDLKGLAIRAFVSRYSDRVSSLYFEITNFPGYFFADSLGVNAQSSAYIKPKVFKLININDDRHALIKLKESLLESKKGGSPPQVKLSKKITARHFSDAVFYLLFGSVTYSLKAIFNRFINKIKSRGAGFSFAGEYVNELTSAHAFMPLQVSSDSQLLINYAGTVLDSVREASEIAKKRNKKLVVKFHPAENDFKVIDKITSYCMTEHIGITNLSVPESIDSTGLVLTVNSTAGFEAQLEGKEVIYIGASQYSHISDESDLLRYINTFFYKGDFFSSNDIDSDVCDRLLKS